MSDRMQMWMVSALWLIGACLFALIPDVAWALTGIALIFLFIALSLQSLKYVRARSLRRALLAEEIASLARTKFQQPIRREPWERAAVNTKSVLGPSGQPFAAPSFED